MSRLIVLLTAVSLIVPAASAEAKTSKRCKKGKHGHVARKCHRAKLRPPFAVLDELRPVTVTVLDGSTITTQSGALAVSGTLNGFVPGTPQLASATTIDRLGGSLAVAPGAPCSTVDVQGTPGSGSAMDLNGDGVVFATLHADLHECGGPMNLWLAGKSGDQGLNALALDAFPGPATAHLVAKVDLSG